MEELQRELEKIKSAMEKLSEEHHAKSVLSEGLRRAHDEQLTRLQEAKSEIEKQSVEINTKAEEISLAMQMYEDLKSDICKKESVLKQLSLANDNLKTTYKEKSVNWEMKNKELVLAIDEANSKKEEQERLLHANKEEIERLKSLLSMSQRKCSDAERRAEAPKELLRGEGMLIQLEQEKGKVEEQLKWKSEQFRYLEEAHGKTLIEFQASKKAWDMERSNLFDEMNTLQMDLDSQTRVAADLRSQLHMCNHALAHEESRRKLLEVHISESKALYENVVREYEEARSNIEALTTRRDDEIGALRNSLATKSALLKEAEFRKNHLELENRELRESLKELQEAQITGLDSGASLKNLRQKFKALEKVHRDCPTKLKASEIKWSALSEKLGKDLDESFIKLSFKDEQIQELQGELEGSYSSLMQQKLKNEEVSIVCFVLESKFHDCCLNLVHLRSIEQEYLLMQKELRSYQSVFQESSQDLDCARDKECEKVNSLQDDLIKAADALDQANSSLAEKTSELHRFELGLRQLEAATERMKASRADLEIELANCWNDRNALRRDLEVSFVARTDAEKIFVLEKERFLQIAKDKDKIVEDLKQQLNLMKEKLTAANLGKLAIVKETKKFLQSAEDLDKKIEIANAKLDFLQRKYERIVIEDLINLEHEKAVFTLLEQDLVHSIETSTSLLAEKQLEANAVYKALAMIMKVHILDEHEIQYKNIVVDEMEEEINTLLNKLVLKEKQSFDLKDFVNRFNVETTMERLEREREKAQAENVFKSMQGSKITLEGRVMQLTLAREELVGLIMGLDDLIGEIYHTNEGMMRRWEGVVKKSTITDDIIANSEGEEFFSYHNKDFISPTRNKGLNPEKRLPLKEQNC